MNPDQIKRFESHPWRISRKTRGSKGVMVNAREEIKEFISHCIAEAREEETKKFNLSAASMLGQWVDAYKKAGAAAERERIRKVIEGLPRPHSLHPRAFCAAYDEALDAALAAIETEGKGCPEVCSTHKYHCGKCGAPLTFSPANFASRPQDIVNPCPCHKDSFEKI